MLYWKYSSNRIFFLNEYWIFIPSAILTNYLIIRKIRLNRIRMEELQKLIGHIEREKKIRKILLLSLGLSISECAYLLIRGGSDLIDTDYIRLACEIEEGTRYLDDLRLRNIIIDLFGHKARGKIIYITATALCHIATKYGQKFLALPIAIGDFGLTNLYQTLRKAVVTILFGAVGPLYIMGGPVSLIFAFTLVVSGLRLAANNLDFIPTSSVDVMKGLKPRIPAISDVVVVNNRNKIIMCDPVKENQECWLPDQRLLNPKCKVKPTEIPDVIDSVLPDLKYEDIVNMKDVTGLYQQEFTDIFDLGHTEPSICDLPRQGKQVNFLEKFGDSGQISENDKWDTFDNDFMVPVENRIEEF